MKNFLKFVNVVEIIQQDREEITELEGNCCDSLSTTKSSVHNVYVLNTISAIFTSIELHTNTAPASDSQHYQ